MGKLKPPFPASGNVKQYSFFGKQFLEVVLTVLLIFPK